MGIFQIAGVLTMLTAGFATYLVVVFSILVQGMTLKYLVRPQ